MTKVIIMAGGKGKRMLSTLPKVLHKINGIPMIVRVINSALEINPSKIIIVVPADHHQIKDTITEWIKNIENITYVVQTDALGTGHAIMCCVDHFIDNDNIVILSGDVPAISSVTIQKLLAKQSSASATILTAIFDNPGGLGRIYRDNDKFVKIIEDKDCSTEEKQIKEINSGIYVINSTYINNYIHQLTNNNSQKEYYITDLITIINKYHRVNIVTLDVDSSYQIRGVNNPSELAYLEKFI